MYRLMFLTETFLAGTCDIEHDACIACDLAVGHLLYERSQRHTRCRVYIYALRLLEQTQRLAHLLLQTEEKPSLEGMMDENARALARIRDILADNALDDFQCVEKIVLVLEELGVDCGDRHDFG